MRKIIGKLEIVNGGFWRGVVEWALLNGPLLHYNRNNNRCIKQADLVGVEFVCKDLQVKSTRRFN